MDKLKMNNDGSIQRFKARFVVRGFKQTIGLDYHEMFSLVARFDSIRTILSITVSNKMYLQFVVKMAFLHRELNKHQLIYMHQSKAYKDRSDCVTS